MAADIFIIRNKIPELSYAFTLNGVELPVLDITHPLFAKCTDEMVLEKLLPYVEKNAEENAAKFNKIPDFVKRYLAGRSFAMAELLQMDDESSYASGITTLMMKLGPDLIGKGKKRFWDRQVNKGFGALVIRMRVRDISKCQAEALRPLLIKSPGKNLCFINIAGGAASDSINALFLIQNDNPGLLKTRKIEINVLDIDSFGPSFADRSITALKESDGRFKGLDISLKHIYYDWNQTEKLSELLSERKEWIQICASEGGLFEYCSDEVITSNLETIHRQSNDDVVIAGSLLHDISKVDAGMKAALKISTNIKPRFLGIEGLKRISEQSHWKITKTIT
ncbi:MAG: hypothetical protein HZB98_04695, partial [Bacteroidia bacterium]|nr:hypothetical protein [Bacteroidia bacterium]